jgi:hypothetical protein
MADRPRHNTANQKAGGTFWYMFSKVSTFHLAALNICAGDCAGNFNMYWAFHAMSCTEVMCGHAGSANVAGCHMFGGGNGTG